MPLLALALSALLLTGTAHAGDPVSVQCLANVVYREARGESRAGQAAVAHVVLNRVKDPAFPDTVCAVAQQPGQFARRAPGSAVDQEIYDRAKTVAAKALKGLSSDPTNGATHFHSGKRKPGWARKMRLTEVIDGHRFFKRRK